MLLTMFLFQKWFGSPFPEDVWVLWLLMHWLQVQFTPCEALPSVWNRLYSAVFSSLRSSLLLVHIFLPNFFLPVNFAFNMLWYSAHWTATPFSNDPLWLTHLLLWRVSMIVFWTINKSAVFPIIVVSKIKRYPECILYRWSFIDIFWYTDSLLSAVSSNHNN